MILSTETSEPETFADLGVRDDICQALAGVGIVSPFPIQSMCIPIAVEGNDLIGQARTGTGKTLAFGVTILQRIILPGDEGWDDHAERRPQALVTCPTRELALQVSRDIATAASVRGARVLTIYGGVGYEPQIEALQNGVDVVVGTPGRLLDLAHRKDLDLSAARITVLDEADEMLDLGFLPDVEKLLAMTPSNRQSMLFSATMPSAIMSLARAHLNKPMHIRAEGADAQATVPDTTQFVYQAHPMDKIEVIARILQSRDVEKVMIFCRTKRACQRLADDLDDRGFKARAIHGDLTQVAREKALKKFRSGEATILVATDVAARGIDVTGVSHVINHECPDDEKTYVHRIGRTGRAGAKGVAVTLVDWADVTRWKMINKALDLGIEEPVETYSTSAHLFTDLDIPEGTKGHLPGSKPSERRPAEHRKDREKHDRGHRSDRERGRSRRDGGEREEARQDHPKRKRTRRRNGEVIEHKPQADGTQQPDSTAPVEAVQEAPAASVQGSPVSTEQAVAERLEQAGAVAAVDGRTSRRPASAKKATTARKTSTARKDGAKDRSGKAEAKKARVVKTGTRKAKRTTADDVAPTVVVQQPAEITEQRGTTASQRRRRRARGHDEAS
ncbi:DEAD/DEAH box helicase [Acidipropionibacterium virtanenii]|uniref:RNA helicase n=1 Tax=Acidipropionibacterium virtanenii TaxID=2057246 RepID=A0A344UTN4_9ACTN|nr:DEAD/DEAH box helicase [Acidipropionibacterium virtanenii]AXE38632.1 DEAD-box ATP-dependent RNA helicase CshA [Acidipropionibacterium virtanenii]